MKISVQDESTSIAADIDSKRARELAQELIGLANVLDTTEVLNK